MPDLASGILHTNARSACFENLQWFTAQGGLGMQGISQMHTSRFTSFRHQKVGHMLTTVMVHAGLSTCVFFLDHTFLQPTSSHDHSDQTVVSAFTGFLHRKPVDCEWQALTRRNGPCSWRFANSWHRSKFPKCRWRSKCRCNIQPLSLGMM